MRLAQDQSVRVANRRLAEAEAELAAYQETGQMQPVDVLQTIRKARTRPKLMTVQATREQLDARQAEIETLPYGIERDVATRTHSNTVQRMNKEGMAESRKVISHVRVADMDAAVLDRVRKSGSEVYTPCQYSLGGNETIEFRRDCYLKTRSASTPTPITRPSTAPVTTASAGPAAIPVTKAAAAAGEPAAVRAAGAGSAAIAKFEFKASSWKTLGLIAGVSLGIGLLSKAAFGHRRDDRY